MRPDLLIVGQGLAGTLLAWEFERAGFSFGIADPGRGGVATRVAAGLVNPITGRRLVKSWRIDALLPAARATYRELQAALGVPLWRDLRVRKFFQDERERRIFAEKRAREELAPFVADDVAAGDDGFWIEGAGRVDLPALLDAARARWRAQGRLRAEAVDPAEEAKRHELVIDCRGAATADDPAWSFVPWEFSKGEVLTLAVEGLAPDVVLHRGHWVLPVGEGAALAGATHEPGVRDTAPTVAAREAIERSATAVLGRAFSVTGHAAGVRVNLPDKRPVAGRDPRDPRRCVVGALGAKGALVAPMLARQWVNHLTEGVPFEAEVDVVRFWDRNSSHG